MLRSQDHLFYSRAEVAPSLQQQPIPMKKILLSILTLQVFCLIPPAAAQDALDIKITTVKATFGYETKEFTVKAGQKVKLTLIVPADSLIPQPHNILIVNPGKMGVVGAAANLAMTSDPNFLTTSNCLPKSDEILFHSKLVQPGKSETIEFIAPSEPGDYPYLCTYPGHWAIMNGVMKVVK